MGPRKFLARHMIKFLRQHGELGHLLNQSDECLSSCQLKCGRDVGDAHHDNVLDDHVAFLGAPMPSDDHDAPNSEIDDNNEIFPNIDGIRSIILLVASAMIVHHLRNTLRQSQRVKKWASSFSSRSKHSSGDGLLMLVEHLSLPLATMSTSCFAALSLVLLFRKLENMDVYVHQDFSLHLDFLKIIESCSTMTDAIEALTDSQWQRFLYETSLWAMLLSVLPNLLFNIWMLLDPASGRLRLDRVLKDFTAAPFNGFFQVAASIATGSSFVVVLAFAHQEFDLIRRLASGTLFLDWGLSQNAVNFQGQVFSSFLAFCIYSKCFSIPLGESSTSTGKEESHTKKKLKKMGPVNPEVINRMATLAQEARARVEQRKQAIESQVRGGVPCRGLARSYSVATFTPVLYHEEDAPRPLVRQLSSNTRLVRNDVQSNARRFSSPTRSFAGSPPPYKHRPSLTSLPEQPTLPYPPSPLLDIHLAGPTLSSKDTFEKLKMNRCVMPRSISTGCFQEPPAVPFPVNVQTPLFPESPTKVSSQTEVLETYCSRSNAQSCHTPVSFS